MTLMRMWQLEDASFYSRIAYKLGDVHIRSEWTGKVLFGLAAGPAFLNRDCRQTYDLMEKAQLYSLEGGDTEVR